VPLQLPLAGNLLGEVLARVEELEKAAYCVDILSWKLDLAWLCRTIVSLCAFDRAGI